MYDVARCVPVVICCEFSALCTTPCHSLTLPHVQIGVRPIEKRMRISPAITANPVTQAAGLAVL